MIRVFSFEYSELFSFYLKLTYIFFANFRHLRKFLLHRYLHVNIGYLIFILLGIACWGLSVHDEVHIGLQDMRKRAVD
ncbi:hypothetical protein LF95_20640 [Thalassospira sp. TSL5-1]|nr:hypothetical protein LF95_20640 [Thalassospira sp. TSL5-1]